MLTIAYIVLVHSVVYITYIYIYIYLKIEIDIHNTLVLGSSTYKCVNGTKYLSLNATRGKIHTYIYIF